MCNSLDSMKLVLGRKKLFCAENTAPLRRGQFCSSRRVFTFQLVILFRRSDFCINYQETQGTMEYDSLDAAVEIPQNYGSFSLGMAVSSSEMCAWQEMTDAEPLVADVTVSTSSANPLPVFAPAAPVTNQDTLPVARIVLKAYEEPQKFCDYGHGLCVCEAERTFVPAAVCGLCNSKYHIRCMQQRSQQVPPALPLDDESVFLSTKCRGIACPSCVRDTDFSRYPYMIVDYEHAYRVVFGLNRTKARFFNGLEQ